MGGGGTLNLVVRPLKKPLCFYVCLPLLSNEIQNNENDLREGFGKSIFLATSFVSLELFIYIALDFIYLGNLFFTHKLFLIIGFIPLFFAFSDPFHSISCRGKGGFIKELAIFLAICIATLSFCQ